MAVERAVADPTADPGNVGTSDNVNALPRGRRGRDYLATNSTGTTTVETICSVPITEVGTDRTLAIKVKAVVRSNLAGGIQVSIYEDGTQIDRVNFETAGAGIDYFASFEVEAQPSPGAHTYDLVVGASGGAGNTVTAVPNGGSGSRGLCSIFVDDVGSAYS